MMTLLFYLTRLLNLIGLTAIILIILLQKIVKKG